MRQSLCAVPHACGTEATCHRCAHDCDSGIPCVDPGTTDERASAIKALGMAPEDGTADGRYAASTGELVRWSKQRTGK